MCALRIAGAVQGNFRKINNSFFITKIEISLIYAYLSITTKEIKKINFQELKLKTKKLQVFNFILQSTTLPITQITCAVRET